MALRLSSLESFLASTRNVPIGISVAGGVGCVGTELGQGGGTVVGAGDNGTSFSVEDGAMLSRTVWTAPFIPAERPAQSLHYLRQPWLGSRPF